MAILSNPAFGPRTALAYITGGLLLDVWTAVYYFAFVVGQETMTNTSWFWLLGLGMTGLVLIALGVFLGPIGRMARQSELPPDEALRAEAAIQQTAAAHPNPVVTGMGGVAGGQPAAPVAQVAAPNAAGVIAPPRPPAVQPTAQAQQVL